MINIENNTFKYCVGSSKGFIEIEDANIIISNCIFQVAQYYKMTIENYMTHDWYAVADYEKCKACDVMCTCENGNMMTTDNSTCAEKIMEQVIL